MVGRRGGKSFISALTAVFVACFREYRQYLNAGEQAVVLVLARDRDQAKIVFRYIKGIIAAIPPLDAMVRSERADEIELENQVTISVKTSDYRAIRGLTITACITDEIAFWDSQGVSPDREVFAALRPAMSTIPNSKLLIISTPYAQAGVLYEAHRQYFGKPDPHTLVWVAPTAIMNPTISGALIEREIEADPEAARSEWLAEFRTDLAAAFSPEAIAACVISGRSELLPSRQIAYQAFTDPSGGRSDSFTLGIGHKEFSGKAVIDCLKAWRSPFDPSAVVSQVAEELKRYGVVSVSGDNYGGEWPVEQFKRQGIHYERETRNKSELYLALISAINSGQIELPDNPQLISELRRLERRRGRQGKDIIDHPAYGGHDDLANAIAGACWLILNEEKQGAVNARRFLVEGAFYGQGN